ncbi:hypothetical protein AVEN_158719-1 [Araneus ventricosus]|uniref:Uncharacterized protein n=1 Tax=Araneus ventricosus TaxID=182803 RepID=A0A4Y2HVV6_ARAVE|nr:hypothetical protein AVEN_158719-1 [Araneus ventricosus]
MTCYTRGEQLFAWQTAYPDATIDVMNEKSGFIRPATLFHSSMSSVDVPGPTVGVTDDDAWSTEAYEWDVCCTVPYPTVSAELCVPGAWTCIVLGCQLSHCLAPILHYQAGQSPTSFFFDDA